MLTRDDEAERLMLEVIDQFGQDALKGVYGHAIAAVRDRHDGEPGTRAVSEREVHEAYIVLLRAILARTTGDQNVTAQVSGQNNVVHLGEKTS